MQYKKGQKVRLTKATDWHAKGTIGTVQRHRLGHWPRIFFSDGAYHEAYLIDPADLTIVKG